MAVSSAPNSSWLFTKINHEAALPFNFLDGSDVYYLTSSLHIKKRKKNEYIKKPLKIYKKKRFWPHPSEAWMKGKQISPLILPHNSLPPCSFHRLVPSFSLRVSARPRFRGTTHSISFQSSRIVTACSAQGPRQGAPHNPAKSSSPLGLIHQSNQVQHHCRHSFKSAHLFVSRKYLENFLLSFL